MLSRPTRGFPVLGTEVRDPTCDGFLCAGTNRLSFDTPTATTVTVTTRGSESDAASHTANDII
jgi:hypothetical protein